MSTIMPKGQAIQNAVKWISEQLKADPNKSIMSLTNEASIRFGLNPNESQFLMNFYKDKKNEEQDNS